MQRRVEHGTSDASGKFDFARLYDEHSEYAARRRLGSFEQERIRLEVQEFKIPCFVRVLPTGFAPQRLLEIGCATGELIADFPAAPEAYRVGVDISSANIAVARDRFSHVDFFDGDFRSLDQADFDAVILSDVLEHVEDDIGFLSDAARCGELVLVNLPLEDNWLNWGRAYGPNDVSGHLRKYDRQKGLEMFRQAGLRVISHHRVWIHETPVETKRRVLRHEHFGSAYEGSLVACAAKAGALSLARAIPTFGRRLLGSNLFVCATCRPSP